MKVIGTPSQDNWEYIYAIKNNDKVLYIGSTNDTERRFKEHKAKMKNKRHSVAALNDMQDKVTMVELCMVANNSFIRAIVEGCYNSIYKPKNGNIFQSGIHVVSMARIHSDLARDILEILEKSNSC